MWLLSIRSQGRTPPVRSALRLCPLVFLRVSEHRQPPLAGSGRVENLLRIAIPKTDTELLVPLARQARAIIEDIGLVTKGAQHSYFRPPRDKMKHITPEAIFENSAGCWCNPANATSHGFRATARTLLEEKLNYRPEVIELGAVHTVKTISGRAYNRTQHLDTRRVMMQDWADYLDELKQKRDSRSIAAEILISPTKARA